jgi:integrase
VILPRVERVEYQLLTTSEVTSLLEVAEEPERTLFALLAYSGLRLGEGLGLKWKDIDFEKRCIRVERTWGEFGWTTPKTTSSRRAVPLSPTLAVMLKDYQTARGATSPDNVVFSHDGTRPLDPGNVRREFYKALEAADLKHVSLHSLRHFFASVMLASGCSIKFLQHSLGHASATMTLNVYSHLIPESAGEAVLRFDELISNEVVQLKAIAGVGNRD